MKVVSLAVQYFKEDLRGISILVATYYTTLAYINHQGGTRSWTLMPETYLLFNKIHNVGEQKKKDTSRGNLTF